ERAAGAKARAEAEEHGRDERLLALTEDACGARCSRCGQPVDAARARAEAEEFAARAQIQRRFEQAWRRAAARHESAARAADKESSAIEKLLDHDEQTRKAAWG